MMGFLVFLFLATASSISCSDLTLHHEFTECDEGQRKVVYYWELECEGNSTPPPVSVYCNYTCPAGTHLDFNQTSAELQCSQCPSNFYSIGGGKLWSSGNWLDFQSEIRTECWTSESNMWEKRKNCTSWSSSDGVKLESGKTLLEAWVNDRFFINAHLVTNGTLALKYHKDTRMRSSYHNGELNLAINGEIVFTDTELAHNKWVTKTFDLEKGALEVEISYVKYSSEEFEDLKAAIEYIEIRGTDYAALKCLPCIDSYSEPGSDSCELCLADTYLEDNECLPCDQGYYSPKGSIGVESCVRRLPCEVDDYSEKHSKCINSTRSLYYDWNTPMICDSETGVGLPESVTGLPCETCSPGQYHAVEQDGTSECKPCPDGTALNTTEFSAACVSCQAGFYAPKVQNYSSWSVLPQEFDTDCKPFVGDECNKSDGWIANSAFLTTGANADNQADIELTANIQVMEPEAQLKFEYSFEQISSSESQLWFFVDGILVGAYGETEGRTLVGPYPLHRGTRALRWVFHRDESEFSNNVAKLYSVHIKGSSHGGAAECVKCADGYFSEVASVSCTACRAGMTSDVNNTMCIPCKDDFFSGKPGHSCEPCPNGTYANSLKQACIGQQVLSLPSGTHFVGNMTGAQKGKEGYSEGLCTKPSMEMFCHNTFYGPLPGNNNYFFVSVMNPSNFSLPSYAPFDDNHHGYAFAVLDRKLMYWSNYQPSQACAENSGKIVVNLGTRIEAVKTIEDGFSVKYGEGSKCSNSHYSSEVEFICDKDAGEGWPVYQGMVGCFFVFRWKTRYACKLCEMADYTEIRGKCDGGERLVQLVESSDCISLDTDLHWEESCSVAKEFMETWPFIIGCVMTGVLVVVAIIALCACRRFKHRYELLSEEPPQASAPAMSES